MEPALRKSLEEHDDPEGCEIPGGDWSTFPHEILAESVRDVQRALRDELRLAMERDGQVQDASFHDELRVLHPDSHGAQDVVAIIPEIAIRFSNFGRLYTVYSKRPALLARYPLDRIRGVVARHGWKYVPAEELYGTYDGANGTLRDGRNTWWIRFFDYL